MSIALATCKGKWIRNVRREEAPPAQRIASIRLQNKMHPIARLRSWTTVYNCVGLVFTSRRTWIDTDQIPSILVDDGYYRLSGPSEVGIGDLAIYRAAPGAAITHVGTAVDRRMSLPSRKGELIVMSKWGREGEYIHLLEDVPRVLGQSAEFWSERRPRP